MNLDSNWQYVPKDQRNTEEILKPSVSYWKDVRRKFSRNKRALLGIILIFIFMLFAAIGPYLTGFEYSDQFIEFKNLQPMLKIYKLDENFFVHVSLDYRLFECTKDGELISDIPQTGHIQDKNQFVFSRKDVDEQLLLDFSGVSGKKAVIKLSVIYNDVKHEKADFTKWNKRFLFGTDHLGRDMLTRLLYGARISLLVAIVATLVSMFVGIIYGSVSGYIGKITDMVMMRIVDLIYTIPGTLYVILFMVVFQSRGVVTIVLVLGLTYWLGMARLVRGQILELKQNDYIMAARVLGISKRRIILRHLVPNMMGPIIVSLTMNIPSAIFTESFLSFLGLGVVAPQSSWGTLASEALTTFPRFAWQLFYPAFAIAFTVMAFNFVGDALADALDPKQKK